MDLNQPSTTEVNPSACIERLRRALDYYTQLDEDRMNEIRASQARNDLRYLENWMT